MCPFVSLACMPRQLANDFLAHCSRFSLEIIRASRVISLGMSFDHELVQVLRLFAIIKLHITHFLYDLDLGKWNLVDYNIVIDCSEKYRICGRCVITRNMKEKIDNLNDYPLLERFFAFAMPWPNKRYQDQGADISSACSPEHHHPEKKICFNCILCRYRGNQSFKETFLKLILLGKLALPTSPQGADESRHSEFLMFQEMFQEQGEWYTVRSLTFKRKKEIPG